MNEHGNLDPLFPETRLQKMLAPVPCQSTTKLFAKKLVRRWGVEGGEGIIVYKANDTSFIKVFLYCRLILKALDAHAQICQIHESQPTKMGMNYRLLGMRD